jgi:hypothetical protein
MYPMFVSMTRFGVLALATGQKFDQQHQQNSREDGRRQGKEHEHSRVHSRSPLELDNLLPDVAKVHSDWQRLGKAPLPSD